MSLPPQVYINVSGGIAEATVMRGEAEIILVDWDNLNDAGVDPDDLEYARQEITNLSEDRQRDYRARLLSDITELIEGHEQEQREIAEHAELRKERELEAARSLLRRNGEL